MPPLTDDKEAKGIVANESLRIHDFVGVIKDLREMCVTIKHMIDGFDEEQMSETIKEFTDPEGITKVEKDMEKLVQEKEKKGKNPAIKFFERIQKFLN